MLGAEFNTLIAERPVALARLAMLGFYFPSITAVVVIVMYVPVLWSVLGRICVVRRNSRHRAPSLQLAQHGPIWSSG
jgi:F420-0:gamma-glutamyl ligase-like protein